MRFLPYFAILSSAIGILHAQEGPTHDASLAEPIAENVVSPKTEEDVTTEADSPRKRGFFIISATIYNRALTKISWWHDGVQYTAFSNIDFNYLRPASSFEVDGMTYLLLMGLGNESDVARLQRNKLAITKKYPIHGLEVLPNIESFPKGRSSYQLKNQQVPADALVLIDALHHYYDENRDELYSIYCKWEADNAAQEKWLKEHPPKEVKGPNTSVWSRPTSTVQPPSISR